MKQLVIACEILYREISYCVSRSKRIVDVKFMQKGLHSVGHEKMSGTLQDEIDNVLVDTYDAILLGYGLCSNGVVGLSSAKSPLVVPRAHDCITLLLGSMERYQQQFDQHPGTYFRSTGWMERDHSEADPSGRLGSQLGMGRTYEDLVAKYGEDNAKYVAEVLGGWTANYDTLGYIDMGVGGFPDYEAKAREEAEGKGWTFKRLQGDIGLLQRLVDGDWDTRDFLWVPPGHQIAPSYDKRIVHCKG